MAEVCYQFLVYCALFLLGLFICGGVLVLALRFLFSSLDGDFSVKVKRIVFLVSAVGACLFGGAKNDGADRTRDGEMSMTRGDCGEPVSSVRHADESENESMAITSFGINSNVLSLSLSWTTNCMQTKSWIELYERISSLTNPWMPRLVREVAAGVTNGSFSIVFTNGVPQASFYAARMDGLTVDFPDLEATTGADGSRVFTSFGRTSFNVAVTRPGRSSSFPPPDPAFAANPFYEMNGASFDAQSSTLTLGGYGTYNLPDGSTLVALGNPVMKFGSPHAYSGTSVRYDSSSGSYSTRSAYPLNSPALQRNWAKGQTPGTGCSCVPSVDFGNGLVIRDTSSTVLRAGGSALPPGMWTDFEYEDGGVWITLYNVTNIVWRRWQEHCCHPDNGGTSDDLTGPDDEDECGCGDVDSTEGSSMGSVRFRIPLGSPSDGMFSGFLYFDRSAPFMVGLSSFELLCRNDALVTDVTDGMVRTVTCFDNRGRRIVLSEMEGGVTIEVRDQKSGDLQHTWEITNDGSSIRMVKYSVLWNVMSDETYEYEAGDWIRTDNVSGLCERRNMLKTLDADGYNREENIAVCDGKTAIHTITDSEMIGTGASAVLRETVRREKGANDVWKVSTASYWNDPAHPRRHGSVRLEQGDNRAWCYRAYDDSGRVVFRLDQRDGSPVPPDSTDYSITNLPSSSVAFATTYDYTPLVGDACKSNDCDKVRVETKYVVDQGAPILIGKTWKTYRRGASDGYPTIIVTAERAASQAAVLGDAGNAVSVEARFDDESADVPYILRGELASRIDEDGVETHCERLNAQGVLRTVERRFFNGNEAKTRRVTEQDWNYGNLLYEAEAISADGTEFGWARHVYDGKNRLIFTQYDDGAWETNAYSCCRLLWTIDRTGAKRRRDAVTGWDGLHYAEVEDFVADLPKEGAKIYPPWTGLTRFNASVPVLRRYFDGLGRETNAVSSFAMRTDSVGGINDTIWKRSFAGETKTSYPQGFSDSSSCVDARGKRTVKTVRESPSSALTAIAEYDRASPEPSIVMTNVIIRGGGSEDFRAVRGEWTIRRVFDTYAPDGCCVKYDIEEKSDGGIVTNSIVILDFLGRVVGRRSPNSAVEYGYDGFSSRIVESHDDVSGLTTEYVYDECGDRVGSESCGVRTEERVSYAVESDNWWRTVRSLTGSGSVTNSVEETRTQLTGLSNGLRTRRTAWRNGVFLTELTSSFDPASGCETEVSVDAAEGRTRVVRKFGSEVERWKEGSGTAYSYYGPTGKVFIRKRTNAAGTGVQDVSLSIVDANGDVFADWTADRQIPFEVTPRWYAYDCRGNLSVTTNELDETVVRTFDADGNVLSEDGDIYPVSYAYDSSGRRIELATTRDNESFDATSWTYDPATGLVRAKTFADDSSAAFTYTPDGLPLRTTNPDGSWTENVYDANRRQVGVTSPDPSCAADFVNDVFGRRTGASNAVAAYGYSLSSDDIATNETASVAGTDFGIVRTLDPYGRQVGLSVAGMPDTVIAYATNGLIAAISNDECHVEYLYDALGGDVGQVLTLSNGVAFTRSLTRHAYLRDEVLSVVNACGTDTNRYDYTYDVLHRPTSRNADTFAYNRRGEVTNEVVAGIVRTYAYDFIGNERPANCLNQYLGLAYSPNGELVSNGTFTYSYDALSRLTAAYSNGTLVVSNRYDHLGRRVVKIAVDGTHTFLYDGWRPLVETIVRSDSTTDRIDYVWGKDISGTLDGAAGIGGLLYVKVNCVIFVPFYDAYGNVMGYRDAEGNVVAEYTYDAFGRTVAQNGTMTEVFAIRYSTKYYDKETGLYYYGKRHYSPEWRRWLNRDPIEEQGGVNLYCMCKNGALYNYDSLGEFACCECTYFGNFLKPGESTGFTIIDCKRCLYLSVGWTIRVVIDYACTPKYHEYIGDCFEKSCRVVTTYQCRAFTSKANPSNIAYMWAYVSEEVQPCAKK